MDLVYFVILVGVLIFVHELGHFAWAKFFRVKVLKFSLGFGPKLVGFRKGETEYVIAAVPLGGYVKLLGENPNDVIRPEDEERAFTSQPLWKKVIIVVAGPAMNLLFPIILYFVVFLGDSALTPGIVGTVYPGRPADGLLEPGDRIVSIDDEEVATFYDVRRIIQDRAGEPLRFVVERDGERLTHTITPTSERVTRELERVDEVGVVGILPYHPTAVVGVTSPTSPAAAAGMLAFDVVISAAGRPIDRWLDLDRVFRGNRGTMVPLTYLRPRRIDRALDGLVEIDVLEPHVAAVTPEPGDESGVSRAGLEVADLYVSQITAGSPEHRMGLSSGDRLLELDGQPIARWDTFLEDLKADGPAEHQLTWRRGEETITRTYELRRERGVTEHGQPYDRYVVGMRNWVPMRIDPGVPNPNPIGYAVREAWGSTVEMVELTLLSVVRLLQGRLTVKSIGGPLTIFEVAGTAAREGTLNYLTLMAFISINLGLINLLPIPLLDGGHLLIFLIEGVSRRKLSTKARQYASLAGLVVLVLLMVLAFKNDIERQWPQIVDRFSSTE
jgi:regulator of sigma E protease